MMPDSKLVSVVETPEFIAATRKLLSDIERVALVDHLARNPKAGDLIPGTGGVRKVRWVWKAEVKGAVPGLSISTTTKAPRFFSSPHLQKTFDRT